MWRFIIHYNFFNVNNVVKIKETDEKEDDKELVEDEKNEKN